MANVFERGNTLGVFAGGVTRAADGALCLPGVPGEADTVFDCGGMLILPGLTDVHVHLREPGFSYKETIATGTEAAARGGYGCVCAMPNLSPAPDCAENLAAEEAAIARGALVRTLPYGCITRGQRGEELADIDGLSARVCAFSDDGRGVADGDMMLRAMGAIAARGGLLAAHCEDMSVIGGAHIHAGAYAAAHGIQGISSESEWRQVERDVRLAAQTGCRYHVCHVSTKESVDIIRRAKAQGVDVTCESAPHYFLLDEGALEDDGRFKMNPPLRTRADRDAVLEGLLDGTIDMIATDHAPHSAQEKGRGLLGSIMGVVGLECAFGLVYTHLVRTGIMGLDALVRLMSTAPAARFGAAPPPGSFAVFDTAHEYAIDPARFASMGKATPFAGERIYGRCVLNVQAGRIVWDDGTLPRRTVTGGKSNG